MRKIVKRIQHNSHIPFGQIRAHSCGDLELIRCEVEEKNNNVPVEMKDKIVEAKPRRLRNRSSSREKQRSRSENLDEKSKTDNGKEETKTGSKTDLRTAKLVTSEAIKKVDTMKKSRDSNKSPAVVESKIGLSSSPVTPGRALSHNGARITKDENYYSRPVSSTGLYKHKSLDKTDLLYERKVNSPYMNGSCKTFKTDVDDIKSIIKLNNINGIGSPKISYKY